MNSKDLGADYVFAWPQAEIGVMGAKPAVGIIHRRELAAADDPDAAREALAAPLRRVAPAPAGRGRGRLRRRVDRHRADARARRLGAAVAAGGSRESSRRGVLLTGATGFVGMEVLARYLERSRPHASPALVRADVDAVRARRGSTASSTTCSAGSPTATQPRVARVSRPT